MSQHNSQHSSQRHSGASNASKNVGSPTPSCIRFSVTPEIAANVREEAEALTSVVDTARAVANAAVASAQSAVAVAQARNAAAVRPILRVLGLDESTAKIVATEGYGEAAVLVIEIAESAPDSTDRDAAA